MHRRIGVAVSHGLVQGGDEIFENVAGGMSNKKQRKIQSFAKEKSDPSIRIGNLGEGITFDDYVDRLVKGDDADSYYYDKSQKLYFKLN